MRLIVGLMLFVSTALAAPQDYRTTPVPILKQINRHNDDGSYSYGYEGADGTFKIETKYPTGEVYGKYGYIGDDGKLREVEYGASKRGFEPTGTGINVAPPTLSNSIEPTNTDYDDGEYREDPAIYYKNPTTSNRAFTTRLQSQTNRNAFTNKFQSPAYQPSQSRYFQSQQQYNLPQQQYNLPQQQYNPPQQQYYQPQTQYYQPQAQFQFYSPQSRFPQFTFDPAIFNGHPATNFDINTGSYTISYTG